MGLFFTTDATGARSLNIPIPPGTRNLGLRSYWQSFVFDPTAPAGLGLTVSQGMEVKVGDWSYTK